MIHKHKIHNFSAKLTESYAHIIIIVIMISTGESNNKNQKETPNK